MFLRLFAPLAITFVASIASVTLISCSQPQSTRVIEVPITVEVEVTREVLATVEVEREVLVTREATVEVETEREVVVTREVPVTVQVERTFLTLVEIRVTEEVQVPYEVGYRVPLVNRKSGNHETHAACEKFNDFRDDASVTFEELVDFIMGDTFDFPNIQPFMLQEMFRNAISTCQVAKENGDLDDLDQFNRGLRIVDHYCNEVIWLR